MIVESYEDIIVLSGALRSNFWETIHTAIALTLKRHPTGVIIDCSGITECTPEGADTFVDAMQFINRQDARIIVAAVPEPVYDVLKRVPEVRSQLPIADSVEEARRSLDLLEKGEEEKPTKRRPAASPGGTSILVCLSGEESDKYLVDVAREVSEPSKAEIRLIYPIIVPRDLPIQSPLPELEGEAKGALERAQQTLAATDTPNQISIERARDVGSAIHSALEERSATQVLIGLPNDQDSLESALKLVRSILGKVRQPVMFIRSAIG